MVLHHWFKSYPIAQLMSMFEHVMYGFVIIFTPNFERRFGINMLESPLKQLQKERFRFRMKSNKLIYPCQDVPRGARLEQRAAGWRWCQKFLKNKLIMLSGVMSWLTAVRLSLNTCDVAQKKTLLLLTIWVVVEDIMFTMSGQVGLITTHTVKYGF